MKNPIVLIAALAIFILAKSATYTVSEWEQVIITQFGEPIGEAIDTPGLKFKLPLVQDVNRFDKRWLEWDGEASEMPTKEKTYIYVDTYARWRIVDPLKFFESVRDERSAQSRLDDIIDSETRNVIAAHNLIEVVRISNREFVQSSDLKVGRAFGDSDGQVPDISEGRDKLTRLILKKAQVVMPEYGIELVDLQFQRVNYTASVKMKVFERMIQDRKSIAAAYRSEGEGESARIRGDKERELKTIESTAFREAEKIRGAADAESTDIYAEAYERDPKFYRLIKSLDSYRNSIDENSVIMLSSDSEYFEPLVNSNVR
jgi:membrane protease subunit HflC